MKKQSLIINLLKLFGIMALSWIFWLIIFAAFTSSDSGELDDFYGRLSLPLGLLMSLIIYLGLAFNDISKRKQRIQSSKSNIDIANERQLSLLDKANRVADKYMSHEKEVFKAASPAKSELKKSFLIKNSEQFSHLVLAYPDLKANENIAILLEQLRETENTIANFKVNYNTEVELYNGMISSFPTNLFRRLLKLTYADYYDKQLLPKEISDDLLGI
jgi:hypothetical protein